MPREVTHTPIYTIYDHEAMTTSATESGKKLGYLNIELSEAAEKLKYSPQLAHEYLSEEVAGYANLYEKIESRLKEFISIYPHPADKLLENYSQIIVAIQEPGVITPTEAREHLTALLPEVIMSAKKKGGVAWVTALVATIKNDPQGRKELIKKLEEKMADPRNEILCQQGKKSTYERLELINSHSSDYTRAVIRLLEEANLLVSHKPDKTPIDKKIFDAAKKTSDEIYDDLKENAYKIIRSRDWTDRNNAMLDATAGYIYELSQMHKEIEKQKPGLVDALFGVVDTLRNEGLEQHENKSAESRARDEAIMAEKAAECEAKYADRQDKESFSMMELADGVMLINSIITSIRPIIKPCDIDTLTEQGQIKQANDMAKRELKQEKARHKAEIKLLKERDKNLSKQIATTKSDIKELEQVVGEIDSSLQKGLKLHGLAQLIGLREILTDTVLNANTLIIAMENLQGLREANKTSHELIEELPEKIREGLEKQQEINDAMLSLHLADKSDSDSDAESIRSRPSAEELQSSHVRAMAVDDGKGGEKTIYVELTNNDIKMTYDYDGKTGMLRPNHKHVDGKGKPMRLPGGFNLPVEQRSTLQEFMKSNLSGFSELTKIQLDNYIDNIPASSYREMMAFLFRAKNGKECEWIAKHKPVNDNVGPDLKSQVQPKVRRDEVEPDVVPEAGPSKKRKRVALYADGGRHSVLPDSKPSTSGALYAPYGNGNSSRRNAISSSRRSEPVAPGNTNTPEMVIMARRKNGDVYSKTKLQQGEWPKEVIHYTSYDSSINIDRDNHINASNIIRGHKTDKVQGFFVTPLTPKDSTEEKIVNEIIGTNQYGGRSNRARILYKLDTSRLPEGTHIWKVSYSKDVFIVEPPSLDKSLKIISSKTSTDEKSAVIWKGEFDKYGKE